MIYTIFIAFAVIAALVWFFVFRKKNTAKTVSTLPTAPFILRDEWFEEPRTDSRVIWKLKDRDTQASGSVECVAYSTQEQLESPPINALVVPSVEAIFKDIALAIRVDNSTGLPEFGGMDYLKRHGLIKDFFHFADQKQMVEFIKKHGTFQTMAQIQTVPRFRGDFWSGSEGIIAVKHSMLVFGVDENIECPWIEQQAEFPPIAASKGAFRVRWHIDFSGGDSSDFIEGWIPFAYAEQFFVKNWTYGYSI